MPVGAATAISGAGAVAGLLGGGGGDTQAVPQSGYQTYPDWLKDIYENTYAPAITENFNKGFSQTPTVRYDNYDPVFGSTAMQNLQQYSDAIGGLYTPYVDPNIPQDAAPIDTGIPQEEIDEQFNRQRAILEAERFLSGGGSAGDLSQRERTKQQFNAGLYEDDALADIGRYQMSLRDLGHADLVRRDKPELFDAYGAAMNSYIPAALQRKGVM